ncbi:hypothetical protein TVAG_068370 [Trichomonas vaginalis G3]|uniref:Bap-like n=1 Tax=Trichomonas vaginalis (strain ATCC PRA-98 / G3) TaxID=412133 RepID=A2FL43_TRIV3|nr:hypothetical protein TVAG_068370 [Trichomonas vaginalis G3]|eukprot:XP_001307299.1 hypothetical protein [Trichomonas vaginalis G3]
MNYSVPHVIQAQASIPDALDFVEHTISIQIIDEYGSKSNILQKDFTLTRSHAPTLNVNSLAKKLYHFSESIYITGKVQDIDRGDIIFIHYTVDNDQYSELTHFPGNGFHQDFSGFIKVPQSNGKHSIRIKAFDQTSSTSSIIKLDFDVRREPGVDVVSPYKRYYEPNETVTVQAVVYDHIQGYHIKVYYSLDNENEQYATDTTITETMNSTIFSFDITIPNSLSDHYLVLVGRDSQGAISTNYYSHYIEINAPPVLILNKMIDEYYYKPASIEINLGIYDNKEATVYLTTDTQNEVEIFKNIESYGSIVNKVFYYTIDSSEDKTFDLKVYSKDKFNAISNFITKTIHYSASKSTPVLTVISHIQDGLPSDQAKRFSDYLKLTAKVMDSNVNNRVQLLYKFDNEETYTSYANYISDGTEKTYEVEIPSIKVNGAHNITMNALNSEGVYSRPYTFDFGVYQSPAMLFRIPPSSNYKVNDTITIVGYGVDFSIGTNLNVIFKYDNNPPELIGTVTIGNNYISNDFTIVVNNSGSSRNVPYEIYFQIENKVYSKISSYFIINAPPEITLINALKDRQTQILAKSDMGKTFSIKKKTDESFVRNIEGTENAQPFSGNIGCYSRSLCMEN